MTSADTLQINMANKREIVLSISPFRQDHDFLRSVLGRISEVCTCREAVALFNREKTAVLICERDLPDGNWKDILGLIAPVPYPPRLIVTSRLADEHLWSEVLNLGGYDVLAKPFDVKEVSRVMALARPAKLSLRALAS